MSKIDEINAAYGLVPPQALEVEEAVLGALMLERDAYFSISEILSEESFYKLEHQIVYRAVKDLIAKGNPVDLMLITQELKTTGNLDKVGGPLFVTKLTSRVASAAHIEYHARIIAQTYAARQIIKICSLRSTQAYDQNTDIEDTLSGLQNDLISLFETGSKREFKISDAIREIEERIKLNLETIGITGMGTGLTRLDRFTGGLQKSDLIIIAGESSQGKTSLALSILKNAALYYKARVAIYSLEMSKSQLVSRLIAQESGISSKRIMNYRLSPLERSQIKTQTTRMENLPIYFDESSCSSIDQICTSLRKLKLKYDINLGVVDYLQLVSTGLKNKSDESQIAEIARRLKNVAKELDIPIIALSQLSRLNTEDKTKHRPSKNRLRGSGQIEEAADIVMMVWRPETYAMTEFEELYTGLKTEGLAECIIEKGRNIGIGTFLVRFNKETTHFYDCAPGEIPPEYLPKEDIDPF
jgi:replicative DNA helicase